MGQKHLHIMYIKVLMTFLRNRQNYIICLPCQHTQDNQIAFPDDIFLNSFSYAFYFNLKLVNKSYSVVEHLKWSNMSSWKSVS